MKRLLDLAIAVPLLLLAMPLMLAAAVWVKIDSPGPALLVQRRIGRLGRPFGCLKLRTMRVGTPAVPTHLAGPDAVTRVGRALRRLKIDELPQLWNVVAGQMSLVGPRPCLPVQTDLIAHRRILGVVALRPGITGLAQVRKIDMSDPLACAKADSEYRRRRSLVLDVAILSQTLLGRSL